VLARRLQSPPLMDTACIRDRLLRQRRQLLARYHDELEVIDEALSSPETEDVERATEQGDSRSSSRIRDTDARAIGQVVEALHRLEDGTYGTCTSCGESIEELRLEVLPATGLCFDCAESTSRTRPMRAIQA
jgi:DnaK suppressor protein